MVEPPTIVLKAVPEAVKEARDWVGLILGSWGLQSFIARTVICELATNAVKHGSDAGDLIVVRAYLQNGRPVVEAWDRSDAPPVVRAPDDLSESGRGLFLMTRMVTRWGTRPLSGGGKVVWAELEAVPAKA
ncbi:ATP-binding protein [Actinomadura sp. 9N407]|uniref:ATP-binding protein n=1 Tax=Actinomadura sp. 9N407 TaxID=3375154 RepID=UPI0037880DF7